MEFNVILHLDKIVFVQDNEVSYLQNGHSEIFLQLYLYFCESYCKISKLILFHYLTKDNNILSDEIPSFFHLFHLLTTTGH